MQQYLSVSHLNCISITILFFQRETFKSIDL
nr:MAG TPA: hypothetical protein [Bacteriophage sp.]